MSNQFIPIERDGLLVVSVQELLAGDHLAQFIVSIVEDLDVTPWKRHTAVAVQTPIRRR